MNHMKKVTQKDRYGNTVSYEFESPMKQVDPTKLMEKQMDQAVEQTVPPMFQDIPLPGGWSMGFGGDQVQPQANAATHPGEPKGPDTVPAWLTPGEFVMNKEGKDIMEREAPGMLEHFNERGRAMQKQQGGTIPEYHACGGAVYKQDGGWINDATLDSLRQVESSGRHLGKDGNLLASPAGALGAYQWLPTSAADPGYGVDPFDVNDEAAQRAATQKYLQGMQAHHGFTPEETLMAYNWGPGNVVKWKAGEISDEQVPEEARQYAGKVLGDQAPAPVPAAPSKYDYPVDEKELGWWDTAKLAGGLLFDKGKEALGYEQGGMVPEYHDDGGLAGQFWDGLGTIGGNLTDIPKPSPVMIPEGSDQERYYNAEVAKDRIESGDMDIPLANEEWADPTLGDVAAGIATAPYHMEGGWKDQAILPGSSRTVGDVVEGTGEALAGAGEWISDQASASKDAIDSAIGAPTPSEITWTEGAEDQKAIYEAQEMLDNGEIPDFEGLGIPPEIEADMLSATAVKQDAEKAVAEDTANNIKNDLPDDSQTDGFDAFFEGLDDEENAASAEDAAKIQEDPEISNDPDDVPEDAKPDPSLMDKAKDLFGGLFDSKELARMAVMAAGSMALGYSPLGSLRWAAGNYVQRIDSKNAAASAASAERSKRAFELAKTDKFSPESVRAYEATGDLSVLGPKKGAGQYKPTGTTTTKMVRGQKMNLVQVTGPDGGKFWTHNGQLLSSQAVADAADFDPGLHDKHSSQYKARRNDIVGQSEGRYDEVIQNFATDEEGVKDPNVKLGGKQASAEFFAWSEQNGLDAGSAEMQEVLGNAMKIGIEDARANGRPLTSIRPYLDQQMIRERTTRPELFQTGNDKNGTPTYIDAQKMSQLDNNINYISQRLPTPVSKDRMYAVGVSEWSKLTPAQQQEWNDGAGGGTTGFYKYMTHRMGKLAAKVNNQ